VTEPCSTFVFVIPVNQIERFQTGKLFKFFVLLELSMVGHTFNESVTSTDLAGWKLKGIFFCICFVTNLEC